MGLLLLLLLLLPLWSTKQQVRLHNLACERGVKKGEREGLIDSDHTFPKVLNNKEEVRKVANSSFLLLRSGGRPVKRQRRGTSKKGFFVRLKLRKVGNKGTREAKSEKARGPTS